MDCSHNTTYGRVIQLEILSFCTNNDICKRNNGNVLCVDLAISVREKIITKISMDALTRFVSLPK